MPNESFTVELHESRMNQRPSPALPREQLRPFSEAKFFKHGKIKLKWRFRRCRAGNFLWQEVFVPDPAGFQFPSFPGRSSGDVESGVDCVKRWSELLALREGGERNSAVYLSGSRDHHAWLQKG